MIRQIVDALAARTEVDAIALGGSRTSGIADPASDYDIYVYLDGEVPLDARESLARHFDPAPETVTPGLDRATSGPMPQRVHRSTSCTGGGTTSSGSCGM